MRSVRDIEVFENIPILVRTALNVPVKNGRVVSDYRLRRALPTVRFLAERGARVVLIGHLGERGTETLAPVALALEKLVSNVSFFPETIGERARAATRNLAPGHILVLENLRRASREQSNDPTFARELSHLADVFVEDAFDTCHRPHASIVGVPEILPSYGGFLLQEEVEELSRALAPTSLALAVIGGAKFNTKEPVLHKLLERYDRVFVGGALANDFLRASGREVGRSLVSLAETKAVKELLVSRKLVLPTDVLVIPSNCAGGMNARMRARATPVEGVQSDEVILDHGPDTAKLLRDLAEKAKTILWSGPLGNYENGFTDGTDAFARAVANSSAHSVVGGGDTVASIENLGLLPRFSFVSTGGGAMLEFLARGTLLGIEALDKIQ